jgi:hypothetical protein
MTTEPMTTDQRVALALTTTLQQSAAVAQSFAALTGNEVAPALGRLAERSAETQTDIAGRLLELAEALAAGKVRIVSEGKLVQELASVFRAKLIYGHGGADGEPASQIREAQLFLEGLKDREVIR